MVILSFGAIPGQYGEGYDELILGLLCLNQVVEKNHLGLHFGPSRGLLVGL
jgi:hypothetical protein